MKNKFIIGAALLASFSIFQSCQDDDGWQSNDMIYPVPVIESASQDTVTANDTLMLKGSFSDIYRATIGGGAATVLGVSADSTELSLLVGTNCQTGTVELTNLYRVVTESQFKITVIPSNVQAQYTLFEFEGNDPQKISAPSWATDVLTYFGFDYGDLEAPQGDHYYSAISDIAGNFSEAIKADNKGGGYDLSSMDHPILTLAVNTGSGSGYFDLLVHQTAIGDAQTPWCDPGFGNAMAQYPEVESNVNYINTNGQWEWRSYDLKKLIGMASGDNASMIDISKPFDYLAIWPRGGWGGEASADFLPMDMNIDHVIITDGMPNSLPDLP